MNYLDNEENSLCKEGRMQHSWEVSKENKVINYEGRLKLMSMFVDPKIYLPETETNKYGFRFPSFHILCSYQ